MIEFIKNATQEFEQNGRSEAFISMENKIIKAGKLLQVYFFARYVKGANAKRLQSALIEKGSLEQCYYFQKYVEGADIVPFVEKALKQNDGFWIDKFIELAKEQKVFGLIAGMVEDKDYSDIKQTLRGTMFEINRLIDFARCEYKKNGRSEKFITCEKYILHKKASGYSNMYLQALSDVADIKSFERVALLRGEPFNMFFIGSRVEGADRALMVKGLEMAKLDYREVEKSLIDQQKQKQSLIRQIKHAEDEKKFKSLVHVYSHISDESEYILQIDKRYIPQIMYIIKHENNKKI